MNKSGKGEDDFRATFLKSLMTKKVELEDTLVRLKKSTQEYDGELHAGDFTDEVDDAQREISAHQFYSLIERKDKERKNIERLIERIFKEEDFGTCEECGEKIPRERLLIIPEATLCVTCQREFERMDQTLNFSSTGFKSRRNTEWERPDDIGDDEDDSYLGFISLDDPLKGVDEPES